MKEFIDMTKKIERKEVRISRFASLLSDAGFKAVLASPRNKKILTQLLITLFFQQIGRLPKLRATLTGR